MSTIKFLNKDISFSTLNDPLLAATGIGAIGSLIGGIFGSASAASTNRTNLQIARETNQANRDNQEYQNEWNLEQWNRQNEYNSPQEQRRRLEAAGLNPIYYGLDGTGNAGALTSAPFQAVNGAPMQNAGLPLAQGIQNAGLNAADIYSKMSQGQLNKANATYQEIIAGIEKELGKGKVVLQNLEIVGKGLINDKTAQEIHNMAIAAEKLNTEINAINEKVKQDWANYDLNKLRYELDKDAQEFNQRMAEANLDLEERKLAEQTYKNRQDLAIAWYEAKQKKRAVDVELLSVNNQGQLIKSNIQVNNGKLKVTGSEVVKNQTQSSLNLANAYATYKDAITPDGILGDFYQLADDIQYVISGETGSALRNDVQNKMYNTEQGVIGAQNYYNDK